MLQRNACVCEAVWDYTSLLLLWLRGENLSPLGSIVKRRSVNLLLGVHLRDQDVS
jgi:hypothetical protein